MLEQDRSVHQVHKDLKVLVELVADLLVRAVHQVQREPQEHLVHVEHQAYMVLAVHQLLVLAVLQESE
jgi:hypothetical protein